jgi:NADH:ubiquinone oxidoreductase subunit F (NADH-binding)
MVFNDTVDLRDVLVRLGRFFQHGCGKCFPAPVGDAATAKYWNRSRTLSRDSQRLEDIGLTMTERPSVGWDKRRHRRC